MLNIAGGNAVLVTGHEHKRAQKFYNHNPDIQDLCWCVLSPTYRVGEL
jgi:hypothetical protein